MLYPAGMDTSHDTTYDLRPVDVARLLGVHPDTVRRWADAGVLPYWRSPTGQRRFRRADIDAVRQLPAPT